MNAKEQAAALRQYEAGGTVAESDLPALEAGARALDLLALAEGAEAFGTELRPDPFAPGMTIILVEDGSGAVEPTPAAARRALAGRLLATALRLVEGT